MTDNTTNPEQAFEFEDAPQQHEAQEYNPAASISDADLVNAAALAMSQKLEAARFKGRKGWQTCPVEILEQGYLMSESPADVMNYAAMLYCRGRALPTHETGTPQQKTCERIVLWAVERCGIDSGADDAVEQIQRVIEAGIRSIQNDENGLDDK